MERSDIRERLIGPPSPDFPPLRFGQSGLRHGYVAGYFSTQSAHFGGGSAPHGMIGTVEVEFFGEPSMMRSE
jgi:hypothetical protein